MTASRVRLKRLYDPPATDDGARVLADRLWPRGKKRDDPTLGEWHPELAPSTALRRAWHEGVIDAAMFAQHYRDELAADPDRLIGLMRLARKGPITLLTAHRDPPRSHLPILARALTDALLAEDRAAADGELSSPVCYARFDDLGKD